jgi:hypothetical protein
MPPPSEVSTAVLLQQLQSLGESMARMEKKLDAVDCRVQTIEKDNVRKDAVVEKVEDHEARLRELEKLAPAMRVVIWVAGLLGASMIALIWALITGSAQILFR